MREAQVSSPVLNLARPFGHIEDAEGSAKRVANDGALANGNIEGFDKDRAAFLSVAPDGFGDTIHEVMNFHVVRDIGAVVEDDFGVGFRQTEANAFAILPEGLEAKGVFVEFGRRWHVGDADHDAIYFAKHRKV